MEGVGHGRDEGEAISRVHLSQPSSEHPETRDGHCGRDPFHAGRIRPEESREKHRYENDKQPCNEPRVRCGGHPETDCLRDVQQPYGHTKDQAATEPPENRATRDQEKAEKNGSRDQESVRDECNRVDISDCLLDQVECRTPDGGGVEQAKVRKRSPTFW